MSRVGITNRTFAIPVRGGKSSLKNDLTLNSAGTFRYFADARSVQNNPIISGKRKARIGIPVNLIIYSVQATFGIIASIVPFLSRPSSQLINFIKLVSDYPVYFNEIGYLQPTRDNLIGELRNYADKNNIKLSTGDIAFILQNLQRLMAMGLKGTDDFKRKYPTVKLLDYLSTGVLPEDINPATGYLYKPLRYPGVLYYLPKGNLVSNQQIEYRAAHPEEFPPINEQIGVWDIVWTDTDAVYASKPEGTFPHGSWQSAMNEIQAAESKTNGGSTSAAKAVGTSNLLLIGGAAVAVYLIFFSE